MRAGRGRLLGRPGQASPRVSFQRADPPVPMVYDDDLAGRLPLDVEAETVEHPGQDRSMGAQDGVHPGTEGIA